MMSNEKMYPSKNTKIYVFDKDGCPGLPIYSHNKIKKMIKSGKAKVICQVPFEVEIAEEPTFFELIYGYVKMYLNDKKSNNAA